MNKDFHTFAKCKAISLTKSHGLDPAFPDPDWRCREVEILDGAADQDQAAPKGDQFHPHERPPKSLNSLTKAMIHDLAWAFSETSTGLTRSRSSSLASRSPFQRPRLPIHPSPVGGSVNVQLGVCSVEKERKKLPVHKMFVLVVPLLNKKSDNKSCNHWKTNFADAAKN